MAVALEILPEVQEPDPLEEIPVLDPVREHLIEARALIADPRHWIQGMTTAMIKGGGWGYCMEGAVIYSGRHLNAKTICAAIQRLAQICGPVSVFNDKRQRTHAEVLAVFDKAIAEEQA